MPQLSCLTPCSWGSPSCLLPWMLVPELLTYCPGRQAGHWEITRGYSTSTWPYLPQAHPWGGKSKGVMSQGSPH